jgi:hypothetical protein
LFPSLREADELTSAALRPRSAATESAPEGATLT